LRAPAGTLLPKKSVARRMCSKGDATVSALDGPSELPWPIVKKSRPSSRKKAASASMDPADVMLEEEKTSSPTPWETAGEASQIMSQTPTPKKRPAKKAEPKTTEKSSPRKRKSSLAANEEIGLVPPEQNHAPGTSDLPSLGTAPASSVPAVPEAAVAKKKSAKKTSPGTPKSEEKTTTKTTMPKRTKKIVEVAEATITSTMEGTLEQSSEGTPVKTAKAPKQKRVKVTTVIEAVEPDGWREIYDLVVELRKERDAPVDWAGSESLGTDQDSGEVDKFHTLIALMLSSQTKDQVVADAMRVSIYVCMFLSICVRMPLGRAYMCTFICVHVYLRICALCMCICVFMCIYVYVYMRIYLYV
jgi:hypothetical protein